MLGWVALGKESHFTYWLNIKNLSQNKLSPNYHPCTQKQSQDVTKQTNRISKNVGTISDNEMNLCKALILVHILETTLDFHPPPSIPHVPSSIC